MIKLISGKIGSGKTLLAVKLILDFCEDEIHVYSNIKLKGYQSDFYHYLLDFGEVMHFYSRQRRVFVIDEVLTTDIDDFTLFLSQSRKNGGADVYFVAQDLRFFPPELRRFSQYIVIPKHLGLGVVITSEYSQMEYEKAYSVGGVSSRSLRPKRRIYFLRHLFKAYDSYDFVPPTLFKKSEGMFPPSGYDCWHELQETSALFLGLSCDMLRAERIPRGCAPAEHEGTRKGTPE